MNRVFRAFLTRHGQRVVQVGKKKKGTCLVMASAGSTREGLSFGYLRQTGAASRRGPCDLDLMSKVVEVLEELSLVQTVDIVRIGCCCRGLREHTRRTYKLWRELKVPESISWESLTALISR